jgi:succinate dehydrogenase / fumarate reductase flavoprotein subunit
VWVPKSKEDKRPPKDIPAEDRDYYLERRYPAFGNLVPRDIASRAAKERCDAGYGVGDTGYAVYLDFSDAIKAQGNKTIENKYGNLFDLYHKITGENPYKEPMKIYPAGHYTMGGLWVDYNLMTTIPGLYAIGEANFSDHGANRLGASALMQGSGDGYFILPITINDYLAGDIKTGKISTDLKEFEQAEKEAKDRIEKLMTNKGNTSAMTFHKRLGMIMWNRCGMARNNEGLIKGIEEVNQLEDEFWRDIKITGDTTSMNQPLEKALRVAASFEISRIMLQDALNRKESCGAHFREEYQTTDGEALRNDDEYNFVAVWEYQGDKKQPTLHKEELKFEEVQIQQRSYK